MSIVFSYLGISKRFKYIASVRELIVVLIESEDKKLGEISIIFTSKGKILEINKRFLNRNYDTDVITFNNSKRDSISGDIYIGVEQVIINSKRFKSPARDELLRVIIHGVLHLIGYDDKSDIEKMNMRAKEDLYLGKLKI